MCNIDTHSFINNNYILGVFKCAISIHIASFILIISRQTLIE